MTVKAVIIEPHKWHMDNIRHLLFEHFPKIEVVGKAESVKVGYDLIRDKQPDIVIGELVIHPETIFDLIDQVKADGMYNFKLIIVTGFLDYEHIANEYEVAYLVHPFSVESFLTAIINATHKKM